MTIKASAPDRAQALQGDLGSQSVESWRVQLDLEVFRQVNAPDGSLISIESETLVAGTSLEMMIPGREVPLRLQLDTVYEGQDGVITHAGVIKGDDGSLAAITIHGDLVLGKIHHSEGYTYLIEGGHHVGGYTLSIIDQSMIHRPRKKHLHDHGSASEDSLSTRHTLDLDGDLKLHASASGEVRLLVLYTPAAASETNIDLLANNLVSSFNQSLLLSGVDSSNYVTLAGVHSIDDDLENLGSRCNDEIVIDMAERDGAFDQLDSWMSMAYADIALTVVTTESGYSECAYGVYGRIGGAAWLIPSAEYPDHPDPFSNTTHTFALADLTAIHEIGHVLNGLHEDNCQIGTIPSYGCGYAPTHCEWQTIMAGYGQCGFDFGQDPDQQPTARIARWSNPDVTYNSEPTGVAGSGPAGRNMAAALEINMPHAATWKGAQPSPPWAPNPISALHFPCWGHNTINWTEKLGATEYRLYQSHSSSFSSPQLVYSGPNTGITLNVGQTTWLRARSCNAGGCSPDSDQVVAHYTGNCM